MKKAQLPKIPLVIQVEVRKGQSGALLARLPEYDVFTEADDLNELFFQVNDLIYTYFDIPKEYQNEISFIPPKETQLELLKIAYQPTTRSYSKFEVKSLFAPELLEQIKQIRHA